jgi:xylulokinase
MASAGRVRAALGIEVGRARTTGVLLAGDGRELARVSSEHPLLRAGPDVHEQDPEILWRALQQVVARLKALVEVDLVGLGLAGEAEGLVFLDRSGVPVRPAILGTDRRAVDEAHEIARRLADAGLSRPLGRRLGPCLPAAKIFWLAANEPEAAQRVAAVASPKDHLRRRLTGEHATDASAASATGLFDPATRRWSDDVLDALGLSADLLPEVFEGAEVTGRVCVAGAAETGLPEGLPVVAGGTLLACGTLAAGLIDAGGALAWLEPGAGLVARVADCPGALDEEIEYLCDATGAWHLCAAVPLAGSPVGWLARELAPEWAAAAESAGVEPEAALMGEAAAAPVGSRGLLFLPPLEGTGGKLAEAGAWFGLRPGIGRADLARSLMEGLGAALAECAMRLRRHLPVREPVRLVGRAAEARVWCELLAAQLGLSIAPTGSGLDAARGAAMLAGIGVGLWPDPLEAVRRTVVPPGPIVPVDPHLQSIYRTLEIRWVRARALSAALED